MFCYDCGEPASEAVAVCQLCGKGVCREHCVALSRPVYVHVYAGMAAQVRLTGGAVPRMLCHACVEAVGNADDGGRIEIRR